MIVAVTVVAGRHDHLRAQRAALGADVARHVVVAMADPAVAAVVAGVPGPPATVLTVDRVEGRLPLAAARNAGGAAAFAAGGTAVVFLDVDVVPSPGLPAAYAAGLRRSPGSVLCGPVAYLPAGVTDPAAFGAHPFHAARPVPPAGEIERVADPGLFWSLSFALDRAAWDGIGGFDEAYTGYGGEDTDFARRAVAAGVLLAWLGGAAGHHLWHPVSSPPVEHLEDILRNGRLFRDRWGEWPMTGWLEAFAARGLVRRDGGDWVRAEP